MRSSFLTLLILAAFALSNSTLADDESNIDTLRNAKVIFCVFDKSVKTDLIGGQLIPRESKESHEKVFDSIDYAHGKARLVATGSTLNAFVSDGGATFFEGPDFDNHSFTTVFPVASAKNGELIAVDSIHALIPGIKMKSGEHFYVPEQRYGSCKVRP